MAHPAPFFPVPPEGLWQHRSWLVRAIGRTYFRLSGWRIEGRFPPCSKFVAIVVPHTSNWDFPLGLCLLFGSGLKASWLGKHTLFNGFWGSTLRRLGGIPVDRSAPKGLVGECVRAFETHDALLLAIAPEGTRKGPSRWRTGFYQIAAGAKVPIFPVAFDYGDHCIHFLEPFTPTGDPEADLAHLQALFHFAKGLRERPSDSA
ncbi:MAG TPA: lysophospholipid acyltransferase family protein [Holophagaceae bacterium]|nr:lysophospholipid acyltransferase family protein [Holophagaceae bacterium]